MTDKTGQKYYYIWKLIFTFEGNCDSKKTEPEPTPEEPKQDNQNQSTDNNNNNNNNNNKATQDTNKNAVAPTPPAPKEDTTDYGTISLAPNNACLINGSNRVTVTATVNNAKDSTIDWLGDACLAISSSGNTATVSGRGCGEHPQLTARLHNGASATVTFNFENNLSVTVVDGGTGSPDSEGKYFGVRKITTNIPAVFSSSNGAILYGDSSPKTSVSTLAGMEGVVTVTTSCGQSKTIRWRAEIN